MTPQPIAMPQMGHPLHSNSQMRRNSVAVLVISTAYVIHVGCQRQQPVVRRDIGNNVVFRNGKSNRFHVLWVREFIDVTEDHNVCIATTQHVSNDDSPCTNNGSATLSYTLFLGSSLKS